MSFEPNDINNTITLGNYEEFFILYMDNELDEEQKKMVDSFLIANPDLQGEFDTLMSTRLPAEEFSFDKGELFAANMKLSTVDEELLLYVDNELPADKKNIVELELVSNTDYQLEHKILLQTKLHPSEKVFYPNKEELYHRTERVVYFKTWMRVAAIVLVIAIGGMFYFRNSSSTTVDGTQDPQIIAGKTPVKQDEGKKGNSKKEQETIEDNSNNLQIANTNLPQEKKKSQQVEEEKKFKIENEAPQEVIAYTPPTELGIPTQERFKTTNIDGAGSGNDLNPYTIVANKLNKDIVNTNSVTSSLLERNTNESTVDQKDESIADNNRKGSVKGFLRKATRMIEKRTGIDPTDDDGKLLIGSVAINLK